MDQISGEGRDFPLAQLGQGMIILGIVALMAAGGVLHLLGRREMRQSPGTAGDPAVPPGRTGTGK